MTTLTNPITGETYTAGSTNYRVKPEYINDYGFDHNDRQRELMASVAYGGPGYRGPTKLGGIKSSLDVTRRPDGGHMSECPPGARCLNKGLEGINIPQGMNPMEAMGGFMQPMQQGFQQVSNQIDNLGDSMNSGFTRLINQQEQQQAANPYAAQQPFPSLPSVMSSPFGNSLFGGIAPFLMNQYAGGGLVKKLGRVSAEAMGKSAETIMRNKQLRAEINALKEQIQKNDDIARDVSMGAARGKARAANEALAPKLKALQDEFMELFQSGK